MQSSTKLDAYINGRFIYLNRGIIKKQGLKYYLFKITSGSQQKKFNEKEIEKNRGFF